eukprot:7439443-Heterocapsa_arctica.AAC.1
MRCLNRNWHAERAELLRVSAPLLGACAPWGVSAYYVPVFWLSRIPAILCLTFPLASASVGYRAKGLRHL